MNLLDKLRGKLQQREADAVKTAEDLGVQIFTGKDIEPAKAEAILRDAGRDLGWLETRVAWLQNRKELREQIDAGAEASNRLREIDKLLDKSAEKVLKEQQRHNAVIGEHLNERHQLNNTVTMGNVARQKLTQIADGKFKDQGDSLACQIGAIDSRLEVLKQQHRPPGEIKVLLAQRAEVADRRQELQKEMLEVV